MTTNNDLKTLLAALDAVGELGGKPEELGFCLAVAQNFHRVESALRDVHLATAPSDALKAVVQEAETLRIEHAVKDKHGRPVTDGAAPGDRFAYVDPGAHTAQQLALTAKHQELADAYSERQKLWNEDVTTLELIKVERSEIPGGITVGQLTGIYPMVADD